MTDLLMLHVSIVIESPIPKKCSALSGNFKKLQIYDCNTQTTILQNYGAPSVISILFAFQCAAGQTHVPCGAHDIHEKSSKATSAYLWI
jgi:hypothetical protein